MATAGYARSVFSPQQSMKLSDGISSFITPWHCFDYTIRVLSINYYAILGDNNMVHHTKVLLVLFDRSRFSDSLSDQDLRARLASKLQVVHTYSYVPKLRIRD